MVGNKDWDIRIVCLDIILMKEVIRIHFLKNKDLNDFFYEYLYFCFYFIMYFNYLYFNNLIINANTF